MLPMHEDVKQRACEDEQPGQPAEKVCPVLGDEVESGYGEEADQGNVGGLGATAPLLTLVVMI